MQKSITLIGMMGAGKTAFGKALAKKLALPFADADHEIERESGISIPQLFEAKGETAFRDIEKQIIARLLNGPARILATGGGAILDEGTRKLIKEKSTAIWLQAEPEVLFDRVKHATHRPLLKSPDPLQKLRDLLAARQAYYQEAPIHVRTDTQNFQETLEIIEKELGTRN